MDAPRKAREVNGHRGQGHCAEFLQQADTGGPARCFQHSSMTHRSFLSLHVGTREGAESPPVADSAGLQGIRKLAGATGCRWQRPRVVPVAFEREDRDASFPPPLGHAGAHRRPRDPGKWNLSAALAAIRTHRPGDATDLSVASSRGAVFPAPVPRQCLPSASDARRGQRAPASPFSFKHRFRPRTTVAFL
jgi:hypothetical protein